MSIRLLTRREVAEMLGVTPNCLAQWEYQARRHCRPGDAPPSLKIGKLRRYPETEFMTWVLAKSKTAEQQLAAIAKRKCQRR